jgi:hypothetical protein
MVTSREPADCNFAGVASEIETSHVVTGENDASFLPLPERLVTVLKAAKARLAAERLALGAAYGSG